MWVLYSKMCGSQRAVLLDNLNRFPGDHSEEETPVLIPNTAVKLFSG